MKTSTFRPAGRRFLLALTGVSIASATAFVAPSAEAQPPAHAPAYGYRNNRDDWRNNNNRFERVRGVVTRVRNDRDFEVRDNNGRTVYVQSNISSRVRVGDQVFLRGDWNGSTFRANRISFTDDINDRNNGYDYGYNGRYDNNYDYGYNFPSNGGYYGSFNETGVVTRRINDSEFELRTQNGRTVRVVTNWRLSNSLNTGDRVQIVGEYDGSRIRARDVNILSNNSNTNWGRAVDFPGRIVDINRNARELRVRGDNGTTYTVRTRFSLSNNYGNGDYVRVRGDYRNGIVEADDLNRIR